MKKVFLFSIAVLVIALTSSFALGATEWYFPEGSTQGFDLWILVTNPNSTQAEITYTFYTDDPTPITQTASVPANRRWTLWVNTISGLDDKPISTKVECTNGLNIYAERAQYWPAGPSWTGGHTARGISAGEGAFYEISQPGSFPITISRSGSYKLTGNIICNDNSNHAIEITASDVTLDLNGFTVSGPNSGAKDGIHVASSGSTIYNITIKNGSVKDFGDDGIGIQGSGAATPVCDCVVKNCTIYSNSYGIHLNGNTQRCLIKDNMININTVVGIWVVGDYTRVDSNHIVSAGGATADILHAGSNNMYVRNTYSVGLSGVAGVNAALTTIGENGQLL